MLRLFLHDAGLKLVELPYNSDECNETSTGAAGIYINFLQMQNFIMLPIYGIRR